MMLRRSLLSAVLAALLTPATAAFADAFVACVGAPLPPEAHAAADAHVRALWHFDGASQYTGYAIPITPANPFDLTAQRQGGSAGRLGLVPSGPVVMPGPVRGHVWGSGLACRVQAINETGPFLLRYYTAYMSFHEGVGAGWTRPMRGGLVHQLAVVRHGAVWRVIDRSGEDTMFLPGAVLSRPDPADIPPASKRGWPCLGDLLWNDRRCAAAPVNRAALK